MSVSLVRFRVTLDECSLVCSSCAGSGWAVGSWGHVEVDGAVTEHRRWKTRPSDKLLVFLCGNLCT